MNDLIDRLVFFRRESEKALRLVKAAECGDSSTVKNLLSVGVSPNSEKDGPTRGCSIALLMACSRGHLGVATLLLDAGAKFHRQGWLPSAVQVAGTCGHFSVVRELLDRGADASDSFRDDPQRKGLLTISSSLFDELAAPTGIRFPDNPLYAADYSALACAAWVGHSQIVEHVLERGADIFRRETDRGVGLTETAFGIAAEKGRLEVVRCMLQFLGDSHPNKADQLLEEAFEKAAGKGHVEVLRLLLSQGLNMVIPDDNFEQIDRLFSGALSAAAWWRRTDIVKILIEDPSFTGHELSAQKCLKTAAGHGHLEMVELLVTRNMSLGITDGNQCPALVRLMHGTMKRLCIVWPVR